MSLTLRPAICFGAVVHTRRTPVTNRFAYPVFFLRLPLSSWNEQRRWPLSIDRPGLMSVWSRDYGARDERDLRAWIAGVLAQMKGGNDVWKTAAELVEENAGIVLEVRD